MPSRQTVPSPVPRLHQGGDVPQASASSSGDFSADCCFSLKICSAFLLEPSRSDRPCQREEEVRGWGTLWEIPRTAGAWAGCPLHLPLTLGKQKATAQRDPGLPTPSLLPRLGREPRLAGPEVHREVSGPGGSFRAGPYGILAESPGARARP